MTPLRRRLAAVLAFVAFMMVGASPVWADVVPRAFIGNSNGNPGGFSGNYYMYRGEILSSYFGITVPLDGGTYTVNISTSAMQGRVSIDRVEGNGCSGSGNSGTCQLTMPTFPDQPDGGLLDGSATLRAAADAPLGKAGDLVVTTPHSGSTARVPIWIVQRGVSQNIGVEVSEVWGNVGDTVAEKITVRNPGPNPLLVWGLAGNLPEGTEYVGQDGCSEGKVGGTDTFCTITRPMNPGESRTLTVRYKIVTAQFAKDGCICTQIGSYLYSTGQGGTTWVGNFITYQIKINGLVPVKKPNPGTSNPGAQAPAAIAPSLAPSESAVPSESATPSASASIETIAIEPAALPKTDNPSRWPVLVAIALLIVGLAGGFGVWHRQRAASRPAAGAEDATEAGQSVDIALADEVQPGQE
ncbi:DUF11 domain-containing protein [Rhizocola hellebori]|uniref:DUF11 domain-containing protein n=1 Tax=Rhizocola hellebori TaxID=1392758 RepID=UPI0019442B51|nr:DUF11 domain-containing protein [Rhizocola hellebori]